MSPERPENFIETLYSTMDNTKKKTNRNDTSLEPIAKIKFPKLKTIDAHHLIKKEQFSLALNISKIEKKV